MCDSVALCYLYLLTLEKAVGVGDRQWHPSLMLLLTVLLLPWLLMACRTLLEMVGMETGYFVLGVGGVVWRYRLLIIFIVVLLRNNTVSLLGGGSIVLQRSWVS